MSGHIVGKHRELLRRQTMVRATSKADVLPQRSIVSFGSRLCENPIDAMIPLLNRGGMMKGFVQAAARLPR
jgi:hypothetical protein